MVGEIKADNTPTFETVVRSKANTIYDESVGCLRLGNRQEIRRFLVLHRQELLCKLSQSQQKPKIY